MRRTLVCAALVLYFVGAGIVPITLILTLKSAAQELNLLPHLVIVVMGIIFISILAAFMLVIRACAPENQDNTE